MPKPKLVCAGESYSVRLIVISTTTERAVKQHSSWAKTRSRQPRSHPHLGGPAHSHRARTWDDDKCTAAAAPPAQGRKERNHRARTWDDGERTTADTCLDGHCISSRSTAAQCVSTISTSPRLHTEGGASANKNVKGARTPLRKERIRR